MKIYLYNNYKVNLLVTTTIYKLIDEKLRNNKNVKIYIAEDKSLVKDIIKHRKSILDSGTVVVTSAQKRIYLYLLLLGKSNLHICIHNVKSWFGKLEIRNIKYCFKDIIRRVLLLNANTVVVFNANMKKEIMKKNKEIKVQIIPFMIFEPFEYELNNRDMIKVVVPGMVDIARKKYVNIIEVIKTLDKDKFEYVFLGRISSNALHIQDEFEQLIKLGYNVEYFDEYIPVYEYDRIMKEATVLCSELNIQCERELHYETYGITKATGIIFNKIKYAKILIVNSDLNISEKVNNSTYRFSGPLELKNCFEKIMNEKLLNQANDNALNDSKKYSVENIDISIH